MSPWRGGAGGSDFGMKAIVIGGGISGLTLAQSLHQIGIPVRVYEAAQEVTPLGVGINLQPNAVRELEDLGLGERLAKLGIATAALRFFNKFGQPVWSEQRGRAAGFNWPQYSIHRGRLQVMLAEATRERIGADLRTGHVFLNCAERSDKVVARFADRSGAIIAEDEADILIGADGIHSAVRRQFYPGEGEPHYNGQILWRAAVETAPFLDGATMIIAGHFHRRIVAYPMAPGAKPGTMLTNWIAQMSVETKAPPREDWNRKVGKERFIDVFRDWRFDWLDFPRLVDETAEIFEFPLVDRHPVERWSFGRVTLIGDAAHPMQPTGSQAGSQAIVDARLLTAALLAERDPVAALATYDRTRRPVMNDITLRNRSFGPEAAMQLAEERAPGGFKNIEDVIPRAELEAISRSFSQAAGLDPAGLNARPALVAPGARF
ncbi:MAG TPA: flavin-dependent oxidoreductase [Stellaceae bacterium]|jgi:2-polyprenyl-6-methoxyphenol hydroxylase-like FAD-dependent oxidoreductase|nr:flavin-dependent oxidoreductase [Stellaceae bacterium]